MAAYYGQYNTQINGQSCGANGTFATPLPQTAYTTNLAPVYVFPLSTLVIQVTTSGTLS